MFSHYVRDVILPAASFNSTYFSKLNSDGQKVVKNYQIFLNSIILLLEKKTNFNRANVFTTNYDGLVAHVAEQMIQSDHWYFSLNDGGVGFRRRILQTKNFSRYIKDQGVFDRHERSVPQINLIQPHGSVYWYKDDDQIQINYDTKTAKKRIMNVPLIENDQFRKMIEDKKATEKDLENISPSIKSVDILSFWMNTISSRS